MTHVWAVVRVFFRSSADYLEVAALASREDSWADSRVLVGYWAAAAVVVFLRAACSRAVSLHSDSDAQGHSARRPGAVECSDDSCSDLVCLPMSARVLHQAH